MNKLYVGGAVVGVLLVGVVGYKTYKKSRFGGAELIAKKAVDNTKNEEDIIAAKERCATFTNAWINAPRIEFQESWNNGTGYFDHATGAELSAPVMAAWSGEGNRRRLLLVRTKYGTIVMFDRYTEADGGVICINHDIPRDASQQLKRDLEGPLSNAKVQMVLDMAI